jgi:hypothetical protein
MITDTKVAYVKGAVLSIYKVVGYIHPRWRLAS